jgi:putative ABC transport system permease protein
MSLWRQLKRGLRALTAPAAADRDTGDEVQHYLAQAAEELETRGLSPEEAKRVVRLEFGNATLIREQVRVSGWENAIDTLLADVRYAVRQLRRNPGFAAVSVLTLALGIGAASAIFSAVNPILFEPLPYPHAGRVAMMWEVGAGGARTEATFHTYREILARNRSFEAVAVSKPWQPALAGDTQPERPDGQRVSSGYFRVLGIAPALGRDFHAADDERNGPKVVILGDALWRRRFGGDPMVVGREVRLDDDLYTVAGVMPAGFDNVLASSAELWSPLQYDPGHIADLETREWGHHLRMVGRLRPEVGTAQAKRELDTIAHAPVQEFPRPVWASLKDGFLVASLQDEVTRGVRPALVAVLSAVLLVLLIASVNVTNLLLARGAQRRGEYAMRIALGAGRARMIRQLLTETLLLSGLGGVLGMVVAEAGVRALVALSPPGLPRAGAIAVNGSVFAFALGITTLIGTLVGLIPALHASRLDPHTGLQQSSLRTAGGHYSVRRILVVAEVALALVLLVNAGLLLRSLERLFAVEPGFAAPGLLTMQVQAAGHHFDDDRTCRQFFNQALDAVRNVPGVTAAAFTSQLPLSGDYDAYGARFENDEPGKGYDVFRYAVTPGYFETLGIPLRQGRFLDARDTAGTPGAVLISESLARRRYPGQDPIGKRVQIGPTGAPWSVVVGVVGDVKQMSLALNQSDAVYLPTAQSQWTDRTLSLVVRASRNAAILAPAIRQAIWSVDNAQPIVRVATMDSLLAASGAERHFALILFEAFALAALVLAATGIYGVLSGSVTERAREIGIRLALGASPRDVLARVVRQGLAFAGLGVLIGLTGALAASRLISTLLFGVSPLDPVTYFGVIALLLAVSGIACWAPAWRASRVEPSIALSAE